MDLKVHRAIVHHGFNRAQLRLGKDISAAFYPIWLGNWLVDMNQATEFFDVADDNNNDRNERRSSGLYDLPPFIIKNNKIWTDMFDELWKKEWASFEKRPRLKNFPKPKRHIYLTSQMIGAYIPYDHFDVADVYSKDGKKLIKPPNEFEKFIIPDEFKASDFERMTQTAFNGVFEYCYEQWIKQAFDADADKRMCDNSALIALGHASHTLQDFFAHSNYVEVMIKLCAHTGNLPEDLMFALAEEDNFCYDSYSNSADPRENWIMTGRFNWVDTIASIIKIYSERLLPGWQDLRAAGMAKDGEKDHEALFEVIFGTFSSVPWAHDMIKAAKFTNKMKIFLDWASDEINNAMISMLTSYAQNNVKKQKEKNIIGEVGELLKAANCKESRDYMMAGRLLYLQHTIEHKLREELENKPRTKSDTPILPHHTLLAKDHDISQPEARLAYKIACSLAADVTTELYTAYFRGQKAENFLEVLKRYYRHPRVFFEQGQFNDSMKKAIEQLYGVRWWLFADRDEDRINIPVV